MAATGVPWQSSSLERSASELRSGLLAQSTEVIAVSEISYQLAATVRRRTITASTGSALMTIRMDRQAACRELNSAWMRFKNFPCCPPTILQRTDDNRTRAQ